MSSGDIFLAPPEAIAEGWNIFDCDGDEPRWQLQRIDDASDYTWSERHEDRAEMTERSEVTSMIEGVQEVLTEVNYEAATRPGEGPEFKLKLVLAAVLLDAALEKLREAEAMLPNNEGAPP